MIYSFILFISTSIFNFAEALEGTKGTGKKTVEIQNVHIEGERQETLANIHFFCEETDEAEFKDGNWVFVNKTCFAEYHPADIEEKMILRVNFTSMQFKCSGSEKEKPSFVKCAQLKSYDSAAEQVYKRYINEKTRGGTAK